MPALRHLFLPLAEVLAGPAHAGADPSLAQAGFPWSVLAVVIIGMGVLMALVALATRKPANDDVQPPEDEPLPAIVAAEPEARQEDDHAVGRDFGVFGTSSWRDNDERGPEGDDWI